MHGTAKHLSFLAEKENDASPMRVVHCHVQFALLFFHRKFLVADHENNGPALIFSIDKRSRELQLGGRAIVGERSFGGAGGQISYCSGVIGGGKHC